MVKVVAGERGQVGRSGKCAGRRVSKFDAGAAGGTAGYFEDGQKERTDEVMRCASTDQSVAARGQR